MAKKNGLGAQLYIGGYDVTNDIGSVETVEETVALQSVTGLDKSAVERIRGIKSGRIAFSGFFNDASLREHVALKSLPTSNVQAMMLTSSTLADQGAILTGKQVGYAWDRPADGSLGISTEVLTDGSGVDWGLALTAGKRTDTEATAGTGVDFTLQPAGAAGSSSFGLVAQLQVFAFTGTDCTLTIQESSDNGVGDAFAAVTGGVFTAVASAPTHERIETALGLTVERYLRVVSSTSGGFSSIQFAVAVKRYATANAER